MIKEATRCIFPMVLGYAIAYLLGAFVSATWTLELWTPEARKVTIVWGTVLSFALWHRFNKVDSNG
jgi:hypothetical protein